MPEWRIHYRWEKRILGGIFPEIEEFVDFPRRHKLNRVCLDYAMRVCRDRMRGLTLSILLSGIVGEDREAMEKEYRYMVAERLLAHDIYREDSEIICPLLMYGYCLFGIDGFKAIILHMFLDEIAKYREADISVVRGHLDNIMSMLRLHLPPEQLAAASEVYREVVARLDEIYRDIAGNAAQERCFPSKAVIIYSPGEADAMLLRKLADTLRRMGTVVKMVSVEDIARDAAEEYVRTVQLIAMEARISYHDRRRGWKLIYYDETRGRLVVDGGIMAILEYADGTRVFYPHFVAFGGGKHLVRIRDLLNSLGSTSP